MGYKILVVDDEEMIRNSLKELLELESYQVEIAQNGNQAWDMVQDDSFDLILTDAKMPCGSGIELLEKIDALKENRPSLIIMTGDANIGKEEAMNKGAFDFVYKPINFDSLLLKVQESLTK